jgi:para-nitrobenzyl esterase
MSSTFNVVVTPSGSVRGRVLADKQFEYLGIPFATSKRFQPPVDIDTWQVELDATERGPISPQVPGMLELMLGFDASMMNEDCLNLNVFSPVSNPNASLPVLVWIHGGAYTNGSGSIAWYDGSSLASRGSVVVTINYRLGALGFLGDGNFGTLDMISALRWVKKNIGSFGGNADNVTIFGESAGGSAVISLMSSPDTDGLINKAWAMSPSIGQLRNSDRAIELQKEFLSLAGVATMTEAAELPLSDLLEAQGKQLALPSGSFDFYSPAAGGPSLPRNVLEAAAQSSIPFVVGTNRDENKLWSAFDPRTAAATAATWKEMAETTFGAHAEQAQKVYEQHRAGESPGNLMSAVSTDTAFRQRAIKFVEARVHHEMPSWMYWFTWATPAFDGAVGCCHALDIPFAFDNLSAPGTAMFTGEAPECQSIATRFADEIVNFATHGHPSWGQYGLDERLTLEINSESNLLSDPESEIRALFID